MEAGIFMNQDGDEKIVWAVRGTYIRDSIQKKLRKGLKPCAGVSRD